MSSGPVFGYAESDSEDELPCGWEERTTADGKVFFANHTERATQWTHPRTGRKKILRGDLPHNWERKVLEDGKIVFINTTDGRETYTDPRLAFAVEETEGPTGPPRQRFDANTKALQILHGVDLSTKTVLITGGNSGIGFEIARSLALHGATVVLACRNVQTAEAARTTIKAQKPTAKVEILHCDLMSLSSVRSCAMEFIKNDWRLDILILNAAVFALPFTTTEDGLEAIFQVNHLAQFYLTKLLRNRLNPSARVIVVSSESHRFPFGLSTKIPSVETLTEDKLSPSSASQYSWMEQYNLTKLCNILFAFELNRQLRSGRATCNALHPGNMVASSLSRHSWLMWLAFQLVRPFTKTIAQAAATTVFCAAAQELEGVGGFYFNNCWFCDATESAKDPSLQQHLWNLSEAILLKTLGNEKHSVGS